MTVSQIFLPRVLNRSHIAGQKLFMLMIASLIHTYALRYLFTIYSNPTAQQKVFGTKLPLELCVYDPCASICRDFVLCREIASADDLRPQVVLSFVRVSQHVPGRTGDVADLRS